MGASLYILKLVIAGQDKIGLGASQKHGLLDLAFFIVYLYSYYWFSIPVSADAPHLTLMLRKELKKWATRDPALSAVCLKKLDLHTWYSSPRSIPLAHFSSRVSDESKTAITIAMKKNPPIPVDIGKPENPKIYDDSTLSSLVNSESWLFFKLLRIEPTFLSLPINEWQDNASYLELSNIVLSIPAVNDAAERTVKLGSDFTGVITKNETRQAILQEVELSQKIYSKPTKQCFIRQSCQDHE